MIPAGDDMAVMECLVLAVEKQSRGGTLIETVVPAIGYLIGRKEARWIHGASFLQRGKMFFRPCRWIRLIWC